MRFTASTQLERVVDSINANRNSQAETKENHHSDKNKSKSLSHMIVESMRNTLMGALQKD